MVRPLTASVIGFSADLKRLYIVDRDTTVSIISGIASTLPGPVCDS